jgi:hypothetical protein
MDIKLNAMQKEKITSIIQSSIKQVIDCCFLNFEDSKKAIKKTYNWIHFAYDEELPVVKETLKGLEIDLVEKQGKNNTLVVTQPLLKIAKLCAGDTEIVKDIYEDIGEESNLTACQKQISEFALDLTYRFLENIYPLKNNPEKTSPEIKNEVNETMVFIFGAQAA